MGRARVNPSPIESIDKGAQIYQDFHGHAPAKVTRRPVRPVPPALVKIGPVVRLDYLAKKKRDRRVTRYFHNTRAPHPELYTGTDGSFHLIGGKMVVTDRGLEN